MTRSADSGPPPAIARLLVWDEPLWRHTSLRVGGPARAFAEPASVDALQALSRWARDDGRSVVVLGAGTNVVFSDAGYDGLVLHTAALRGRSVEGARVRAAAGEGLAGLAWWTAKQGLSGLEWGCAIPGSLGGAVVMNAGTRDGDIAGTLVSADVLTDEGVGTVPASALRLGYRTSAVLAGDLDGIIVGATFELRRDAPQACVERARACVASHLARLPVGASAGSIFRNPRTGPTAGELLDRAGCKGLRIGRAIVSAHHADVIVNEGTDNAADVLALIDAMKRRVHDAFGIELSEEVVIHSHP
jgi:UDP-N-acetylmuramate dehydrogenase